MLPFVIVNALKAPGAARDQNTPGRFPKRPLLAALRPSTTIPIADIALRLLLDVAVAAPSSPPKTCARQIAGSSGQCAGRITRPLGRSCVIRLLALNASPGDTAMPASSRTLAVHTLQVLNRWNFSRDA